MIQIKLELGNFRFGEGFRAPALFDGGSGPGAGAEGSDKSARAATIFTDNGAPQALVACYENSRRGAEGSDKSARAATIFTDNGAPQALVASQGGNRGEVGGPFGERAYGELRVADGWRARRRRPGALGVFVGSGGVGRFRWRRCAGARRWPRSQEDVATSRRASRSCSGARLEAEAIDGARRDAGRRS